MTPEAMKAWEDRLGPEKVQRAIKLVRSHGWKAGDTPPTWVWGRGIPPSRVRGRGFWHERAEPSGSGIRNEDFLKQKGGPEEPP